MALYYLLSLLYGMQVLPFNSSLPNVTDYFFSMLNGDLNKIRNESFEQGWLRTPQRLTFWIGGLWIYCHERRQVLWSMLMKLCPDFERKKGEEGEESSCWLRKRVLCLKSVCHYNGIFSPPRQLLVSIKQDRVLSWWISPIKLTQNIQEFTFPNGM